MLRCKFIHLNVQSKQDFYDQLFSLGHRHEKKNSAPTHATTVSKWFLHLSSPCAFCHFSHNTRIHSAVPRRRMLDVSGDSVGTLCCKRHCFSTQLSLSCLCVLKCLHATARRLEDTCAFPRIRFESNPSLALMELMTPFVRALQMPHFKEVVTKRSMQNISAPWSKLYQTKQTNTCHFKFPSIQCPRSFLLSVSGSAQGLF